MSKSRQAWMLYAILVAVIFSIYILVTVGCNNEQVIAPKIEQTASGIHYNAGRIKIKFGDGIIMWADSTKDTLIEYQWCKIIYNANEMTWCPYEFNQKGFTTVK